MSLNPEMSLGEPVFIVSGLPRSGTSLMMKMLQAAGFDILTDHLRQGDEFNPNGYFEFEPVKELKTGHNDWLKAASGQVVKIVSPLLQYLPEDCTYKIIFMQRDLAEVMASQARMLAGFQKSTSAEKESSLELVYREHLLRINRWMSQQSNLSFHVVDYNLLFSDPHGIITELTEFLERPLPVERMIEIIDPNLYRNRHTGLPSPVHLPI